MSALAPAGYARGPRVRNWRERYPEARLSKPRAIPVQPYTHPAHARPPLSARSLAARLLLRGIIT